MAQNKIRLFPHWRNACPGQASKAKPASSLIDPSLGTLHGDTTATAPHPAEWPLVTTPTPEWAYAIEFPLRTSEGNSDAATITVELTVTDGAIGIGCLGQDGRFLCETFRAVEDGQTTMLIMLQSLAACKSLMIRNVSTVGRSIAQIHSIALAQGASVPPPLLEVPAETFARYSRWSGVVPSGYVIDWLGTRTRGDVEDYLLSAAIAPLIAHDRQGTPSIPASELLLDWVPLLEAVELAGERFTTVALGAGWGRWIVAGAYAAMQRKKEYRLVGVEAEPQHFAWMQRHLEDNEIDAHKARLIPAAANAYTGFCMFQVGNPTGNYGQSIISDAQLQSSAFMQELEHAGLEPTKTPCVDLVEVLQGIDRVDYMHMDIQGSEADFLLAYPEQLDALVAIVNIGTHAELIERRLRRHFTTHGWLCRYDIPMNSSIMACLKGDTPAPIALGDGVQVWENPRLTGREEAPSFVAPCFVTG